MTFGNNVKTITVGNPETGEMIDITPGRIIHYVNIHDELVDVLEAYLLHLAKTVGDDSDIYKKYYDLFKKATAE